jgi:DNA-binding NarL/FixJ family response regulator
VLEGLLSFFSNPRSRFSIVTDLFQALETARSEPPDLLIVDSHPGEWALERVVRELAGFIPASRIVGLVGTRWTPELSLSGSNVRILPKSSSRGDLLDLLGENSPWILLSSDGDPGEARKILTTRQAAILRLLSRGKVVKEIGAELRISPRTVECHKYRLMKQLGVSSAVGLVRYAIETGLMKDKMAGLAANT